MVIKYFFYFNCFQNAHLYLENIGCYANRNRLFSVLGEVRLGMICDYYHQVFNQMQQVYNVRTLFSQSRLQKLAKKYLLNKFSLQIVGVNGVGKHELATRLLQQNKYYSLKIHTATKLPLPADSGDSRPNMSFIIFLLDVTSKESFKQTKEVLASVAASFFLGKTCLVVRKGIFHDCLLVVFFIIHVFVLGHLKNILVYR